MQFVARGAKMINAWVLPYIPDRSAYVTLITRNYKTSISITACPSPQSKRLQIFGLLKLWS